MILNLSELSDEPLHAQISRQIRAKILSDVLGDGDDLPSIRVLARQQRVSVTTVRRAYQDLEREGLIWSRPGKGFWVTALAEGRKRRMAQSRFRSELEEVAARGAAEGLSRTEMRRILERVLEEGDRP